MFAFDHFKVRHEIIEKTELKSLPTVSVCVPARNETHAMTQCLESVIASNYPKLEIIVFDDNSADNTSVLIKSFEHEGVRFVEGSQLEHDWLGKNNALQGLMDEASGELILYIDVDTHIQPNTIEKLVSYMTSEGVAMVSVLPRREDSWRPSVIFSTLRYFWTLILHQSARPAIASGAWMIDRQVLSRKLGGVKAYQMDIQPETKIAARLMRRDLYRFLIGTPPLGISYEKKWRSQIDTSIRLMFPNLDGKPLKLLLAVATLLLLNMPSLALIAGLIEGWTIIQTVALWQLCVFIAIYGLYLSKVWNKGWWLGALLWPIIVAQELIVLMMSIDRNLRHTVTWKGRPITSD